MTFNVRSLVIAAAAATALVACGNSESEDAKGAQDGGTSDSPGQAGNGGGGAAGAGSDASGPSWIVHVVTTTDAFNHTDGYSGQTSRDTWQGVRSFQLLHDAADTAPVLVFDHGNGFVEAGYNNADDTIVGSAPIAVVPAGKYTLARFGVSHSRYRVYSTMHAQGSAYPGDFNCVQVLSDNTSIDGVERALGWYRYIFEFGGQSYPQEGADAPLPTSPTTGGFTMITIGGQTYYDFPIVLDVPASVDHDMHVGLKVNMFESFRWEDQNQPGYAPAVYDTTPTSFEPVRRFGANAAELIVLNP
ncbi:MAG: hypothetical protein HY898_32235 [Deltaproteobacteria bacterium]|nr:hypothetical protein [Deltaproteobacteria bacterium]